MPLNVREKWIFRQLDFYEDFVVLKNFVGAEIGTHDLSTFST